MKLNKAILVLKQHNKWRRGDNIPMTNPTLLGKAIDTVLKEIEKIQRVNKAEANDLLCRLVEEDMCSREGDQLIEEYLNKQP